MVSTEWMQDEKLKDISKDKLDFLQKLAFESSNLDANARLPFFMALANKAKQSNISFTSSEMELIIGVIKQHAAPNEIAKMEQILKVYRNGKL